MDPDDGEGLRPEAAVAAQESPPEGEDLPPLSELSFLRSSPADVVEDQPILLAALMSLAFALALVLLMQMVIHERNAIAAAQPRLAPWLTSLCQPLNCGLSPVQRIGAVMIESSSFSRARGDSFRLTIALKNTALVAVAVPSIELTLTDAQDQALLRRVILPDELQLVTDALEPGVELLTAVDAALAPEIATGVAGYRMVAFYP
ncbi:MAG: DUF3426 domain-containing protein [Betaproteobacteria bacterium]